MCEHLSCCGKPIYQVRLLLTVGKSGYTFENGLFDETLAESAKVKVERKDEPILIYSTGMVYAARGQRAEALRIIKELEGRSGESLGQAGTGAV